MQIFVVLVAFCGCLKNVQDVACLKKKKNRISDVKIEQVILYVNLLKDFWKRNNQQLTSVKAFFLSQIIEPSH